LRALPGVRDAVVIAVMKDGQAEGLVAFVILNERPAGVSDFKASNNLRSQLAQRLPAYMLPRKFHFLDAFPMNANGKADRKKLAESLA
jgi:D-alanine--poly(phosphoribitol) ligase subunit 1